MPIEERRSWAAVGARLIKLRQSVGMSQSEFIGAMTMGPIAYDQIENGQRDVTIAFAQEIQRHYSVPAAWVLEGDTSAMTTAWMDRLGLDS